MFFKYKRYVTILTTNTKWHIIWNTHDEIRIYIEANPDLSEIVNGEVDFYAHCVTKNGIKKGLWEKVGNIRDIGHTEHIIFKDKEDYTKPDIQNDWWIWKINSKHLDVGELKDEYKKAHLGLVFQPERIMDKLKTGYYTAYSEFE